MPLSSLDYLRKACEELERALSLITLPPLPRNPLEYSDSLCFYGIMEICHNQIQLFSATQIFLPTIVPSQTANKHKIMLKIILIIPSFIISFSKRWNVSMENAENVVKPPKNPINTRLLSSGPIPSNRINRSVERNPINREPTTFTIRVPYGKSLPNKLWVPIETRYRRTDPTAPPMAIRNKCCNFPTFLEISSLIML